MSPPSHRTPSKNEPKWGASRRLQFIEFMAYWEGGVNRSDITQNFSVSVPQASADLATYQDIAPGNLVYNASEKRYVATASFTPHFVQPSTDQYLAQLSALQSDIAGDEDRWQRLTPVVDSMPLPTRPVDREILRQLLRAVRETKSLEVEYYSMNAESPRERWRRITPHAFAFDGFRWHVRAWCHRSSRFKDFLLSRCCKAQGLGPAEASADEDELWYKVLEVSLVPNSALTQSQREAVELDYGMKDGVVHVAVRMALLYYFDKHINPALPPTDGRDQLNEEARRRPVMVRDPAAYTEALGEVGVGKAR